MVPLVTSTVPDFSNWKGPAKLGLVSDGGGPKYERGTDAPVEGGAGKDYSPVLVRGVPGRGPDCRPLQSSGPCRSQRYWTGQRR